MERGIFFAEHEAINILEYLKGFDAMLREQLGSAPKFPLGGHAAPKTVNRLTAAYYLSTGGLPDNLDRPPMRGITRFDELVKAGEIPYVMSGKKKLYKVAELDAYMERYRTDPNGRKR